MFDKGRFLIPSSTKRGMFLVAAAAACALVVASKNSSAFEKDLQVGIHLGYSGTYSTPHVIPNIFDGFAGGAQAVFGITDSVGLSLDGTFDWHRNYREYEQEEVRDDEGEISMEWVPKAKISRHFVTTGSACLVYAIDITRIIPYFTGGVVGVRRDRTADGVHDATFGIGLRLGGGLDYFFKRWAVGAAILSDRYYGGNSELDRRVVFLVRASYVFHFGAEILAKR
jgi:hypothetical protein